MAGCCHLIIRPTVFSARRKLVRLEQNTCNPAEKQPEIWVGYTIQPAGAVGSGVWRRCSISWLASDTKQVALPAYLHITVTARRFSPPAISTSCASLGGLSRR